MNRAVLVLIGSMMAGGMAAAEATGIEEPKEVVFDVGGVEITAQAELEAVEGARQIRNDPNEGPYTAKEMQKEKELDREWKQERARGLVTQKDLGERAVAHWDEACKFLTLISGPQLDSGRIWSDTETVNVINYMMEKKWITNDFTVKDPSAIVDYAAKKCGFHAGDRALEDNGKLTSRYLEMIGRTVNKNPHTNLCDLEGRLIWDPYNGGEDRILQRTDQRFIRFE